MYDPNRDGLVTVVLPSGTRRCFFIRVSANQPCVAAILNTWNMYKTVLPYQKRWSHLAREGLQIPGLNNFFSFFWSESWGADILQRYARGASQFHFFLCEPNLNWAVTMGVDGEKLIK